MLVLPLFTLLFQALNPLADTIPYPTFAFVCIFLDDPKARSRGRGPGGDGMKGRDVLERPVGVVWRFDMFPASPLYKRESFDGRPRLMCFDED